NYELRSIGVRLHDNVPRFAVFGGRLVVHEDKGFLWYEKCQRLYVGWMDDDTFSWAVEETTGAVPSGRNGSA
ncbi:hypothetical protein PENTCL1PPCAC_15463, partial [Pristionchus entomophagus]